MLASDAHLATPAAARQIADVRVGGGRGEELHTVPSMYLGGQLHQRGGADEDTVLRASGLPHTHTVPAQYGPYDCDVEKGDPAERKI